MTPGNYCTHASEDLTKSLVWMDKRGPAWEEDMTWHIVLLENLQKSMKFFLPNTGRLLNGEQDLNLISKNLRLPASYVTLEYTVVHLTEPKLYDQQHVSTKRVVHAFENLSKTGYWITTVDWIDDQREWQCAPALVWIPYDIDLQEVKKIRDGWTGVFGHKVVCPQTLRVVSRNQAMTRETMLNYVLQEILWDWESVIHLTNVLACNNACTEKIEPSVKLNKKRAASGKPPFDSYHVLKITLKRSPNARSAAGGTGQHVSPRQHIRRGHIRHIGASEKRADPQKRGGYTVWIEQMLVGNPDLGRVEKDYAIMKD